MVKVGINGFGRIGRLLHALPLHSGGALAQSRSCDALSFFDVELTDAMIMFSSWFSTSGHEPANM